MAIQMMVMPAPNCANPIVVNGRSYASTLGAYLTVPLSDGQIMTANGWLTNCARGAGTTADRPLRGSIDVQAGMDGTTFFDTTVGSLIIWDGVSWRSLATGGIV